MEFFTVDDFKKDTTETTEDYKIRCYTQKVNSDLTWVELAVIMNYQLGINHSESYYRKESKKLLVNGSLTQEFLTNEVLEQKTDSLSQQTFEELLTQIKLEKYKLSEERSQNNSYIRKLSREQTLKEIASEFANVMSSKKYLSPVCYPDKLTEDKIGILMLSDWHYGIEINNYFNKYNPQICRERISKLRDEVIKLGEQQKIKELYVVNLSDLICGRIHLTLRLESRIDVISQVMEVSEILAELLCELSSHFNIKYMDVMDNHSRLEPNKKDSLELETLVRIIPWYLKQRLIEFKNITFLENNFADDIAAFKVFDFNVVAVHGHKDKPTHIIKNLSVMTQRKNDLVLSAHFHHMSIEESDDCVRFSNGSLMGVDTHAQDLRLVNKPSQTLIVSTPENVLYCVYKINF